MNSFDRQVERTETSSIESDHYGACIMGAFAAKVTIFFVDTGLCAHASMFDLLGSAGATVDLFSDSIGAGIISSSSALSLATHFEHGCK